MCAIDLHTHTTMSDGTSTPEGLVALAAAAGVTALGITDHEQVDACERAAAAAREAGIALIPGVEIEAACDRGLLHILGYAIDPTDATLRGRLAALRAARVRRNEALCAALGRGGSGIALADVAVAEQLAPEQIGIRHIVKALVRLGLAGGPAQALHRVARCAAPQLVKPDAATCIAWIRDAGGTAVWAHPVTVAAERMSERAVMLADLARAGLGGIEAIHPAHPPQVEHALLALAAAAGLLATGGSDHHGARRPGRSLGISHPRVASAAEQLACGAGRAPIAGCA